MILPGYSGLWHIQRLVLRCLCSIVVMSREPFHAGDVWHCDKHHLANVKIDDASMATVKEQRELTRVENA